MHVAMYVCNINARTSNNRHKKQSQNDIGLQYKAEIKTKTILLDNE